MIITCDECHTSFNLDDSLLKETGSKVRCSMCKHIFTAYPPAAAKTPDPPQSPSEFFLADADGPADEESGQDLAGGSDEKAFGATEGMPGDAAEQDAAAIDAEELEDVARMFELDEASEPDDMEPMAEALDLDLDLEAEAAGDGDEAGESELDLADLEEGLEREAGEPVDEKFDGAEDGEAELDLDLDFEAEDAGAGEGAGESELDLADLEEGLEREAGEPVATESPGSENAEETFDLDLHLESEEPSESEEETEQALDLSEMGDLLGIEEGSESGEAPAAVEISDLGLEGETDLEDRAGEGGDPEAFEEETLDLSDIEKMIEEEETAGDAEALGAASLDTDAEEATALETAEDALSTDKLGNAAAMAGMAAAFEDEAEGDLVTEETGAKAASGGKKRPSAGKKRIGAPVGILIVLVLLGGAGYGAYRLIDAMGIQVPWVQNLGSKIPYISQWFKPVVEDAGNLKIQTSDIAGKFINNTMAGKLFVITGNAKNGYDKPRSLLKITGKLYSGGKKLEKTETVFCGNTLTDAELTDMDMETIQKRLNHRAGQNKMNMNVAPGRVVPFMLVFSNLPENLEEYTIEVDESFPAAGK